MSLAKFHTKTIIKKFRKHFIIGGGIVIIIILLLSYSATPTETQVVEKPKVDNQFTAATNQTPNVAEVMQQHLSNFEADQQRINQQNITRIAQLESQNAAYRQAAMEAESNANKINEKLAKLNTVTTKVASSATVSNKHYIAQKLVIEDDINDKNKLTAMHAPATGDGSRNDQSSPEQNDQIEELATPKDKNTKNSMNVSTYIPSNSFVKGVLVSSLSANTGGNASADPTPVLIRITDLAQLPNSFRSNVKSCMLGGSGYGSLSTERVMVRLTTLSCVLKSGKALDIKVYGYIAGEDAKAGIKGMVVTHSGTVAAKAALAGFLQGIGQVGQAMGQTQTITPLGGVTTTISPSQALYAGGGSGVSQVGSTLSQYYLNMMKDINPAIEVSAGRHITVIFEQGVELKLPINEDINNQPLPLDEQE